MVVMFEGSGLRFPILIVFCEGPTEWNLLYHQVFLVPPFVVNFIVSQFILVSLFFVLKKLI